MGDADANRSPVPADKIIAHLLSVSPVARHWGMEIVNAALGRAELAMAVREDMSNTHGICHGGVIFSLADTCFGFAANSYNDRTVAASCEIKFLQPAKLGDELTAVANELWKRGRSALYDVTVSNQHGEPVAFMRAHARRIDGHHLEVNDQL